MAAAWVVYSTGIACIAKLVAGILDVAAPKSRVISANTIKKREDSKLLFSVPRNKKGESESLFTLRDILKSTSGNKTDFMCSVIMNNLVETMEPNYISEGLKWLME